jgi:2-polyprenyl-3-methyl-5-hydroxy-6-metoxy-1,4-benzoquinol methylase
MSSEFWNERYSSPEYVYGKDPNDFFREYIEEQISGKILLVGEGEGRNAIYAAQRGWTVDALDVSQKGKDKAQKLAREKGVRINYEVDNILFHQPKQDFYNLIGVFFLHLPRQQRRILSVKLWEALRPGGKMIMEVFSKDQLKLGTGGPKESELLYNEQEMMSDFPCFKFEKLQQIEREIHEGSLHKGRVSVVQAIGVK